jgi:hypothetical protein
LVGLIKQLQRTLRAVESQIDDPAAQIVDTIERLGIASHGAPAGRAQGKESQAPGAKRKMLSNGS